MRNPPYQWGLFPPFGFFNRVTAHHKEQLAQSVNSEADGASLFAIRSHRFPFTQSSREQERRARAILGHCNVCYSAISSSNCRGRGILYISSIEAQQLQLAWHVVGVFKGGVVATSVSKKKKNNKQKKATHTLTPLHKFAKMHLCRIMPLHFLSLILCTPYHTRGKLLCSKSVTLFSAARQHHAWSHWFRRESAAVNNYCLDVVYVN